MRCVPSSSSSRAWVSRWMFGSQNHPAGMVVVIAAAGMVVVIAAAGMVVVIAEEAGNA